MLSIYEATEESDLIKKFRTWYVTSNHLRLFVFRDRRLILRTRDFITSLKATKNLNNFERYTDLPVLYIGWLFFLPRLILNLAILLRKRDNLAAAWKQHWFEIVNDTALLTGGILNCFLFINKLAYIAPYMSFATQFFEVLNSTLRFFVVIADLQKQPNIAKVFLNYETLRLSLSILSNTLQSLGMVLFLPGFSSVAMMAGAIILVITTVAWFITQNYLTKIKPEVMVEEAPRRIQNIIP